MERVILEHGQPAGLGVFRPVAQQVGLAFMEERLGLRGPPVRNLAQLQGTTLRVAPSRESPG